MLTTGQSLAINRMVKLTLVFCLLISTLTNVKAQCSIERARFPFTRALYEFSTEIMKRYSDETENHFVVSPLSLWTLISVLSEGASGDTLLEIQSKLNHHPHKCFNRKYFDIIKSINSDDDGVTLGKHGTLIVNKHFNIKPSFLYNIRNIGICDVESMYFDRTDETTAHINNYISNVTQGTITDVVSAEDVVDKDVLLIDVIHFKGKWKTPFSEHDTEVSPFYNELGEEIGEVNSMYSSNKYKMKHIDNLHSTALELPYGANDQFSMLILLPDEGVSLNNVFNYLINVSLKSILYVLNESETQDVQVSLPKFILTTNLENLPELLVDMGISKMFDANSASFHYMTDENVYVGDVLQKAVIKVTEEGTTASVASSAGIESRILPAQFNANRPFVFFIIEKEVEVILFCGAYSKPSIY